MLTCSIVQLGANTILNYLKPSLPGLLKSSVKYILVYKSLIKSSHCSVCKLLAFGMESSGSVAANNVLEKESVWGKAPSDLFLGLSSDLTHSI